MLIQQSFINKAVIVVGTIFFLTSCCCCKHRKCCVEESSLYHAGDSVVDLALIHDFESLGGRVFFDTGSAVLSETAKQQLKKQVVWLNANPNVVVDIQAYCDERGGQEYNLALGARRAEAIHKFLLEHGIASDRLITVSYGKDRQLSDKHTEEAWQQNRRAVTRVIIRHG